MFGQPARPVDLRRPLLADPDNARAQYIAAAAAAADGAAPGPLADALARLATHDEGHVIVGTVAAVLPDLAGPIIADALAGAGIDAQVAQAAAQVAARAIGQRPVAEHRVRSALALTMVVAAQRAYRISADPADLLDPTPPGAHVTLRGVGDWQALEAEVRAALPPCPAEGEVHARRVQALGHHAAMATGGDAEMHHARQLDALAPEQRAAHDAFLRWSARYYRAMAERVVLRLDGVLIDGEGEDPVTLPPEACEARGKRFPVAAFEERVQPAEAREVWAEAVELARVLYAPGKARRSRASASGRVARRTPDVRPGGPATNASATAP